MKKKNNFKHWVGIIFFSTFIFLVPFQSASAAIACKCTGAFKFSPSYPGQNVPPDVNFNKCVTSIDPTTPLKNEKDCMDRAYDQFFSENDPKDNFTFNGTCTISPQCDNPLTTAQALKLDIRKPILEIIIPNLKFTDVANTVDENGNLQFPWIGEYIKAVYRFGVSIASILGVIMIIIEGVRIVISAGGEEKVAGYKHIGRICAGLCLAWFSYVILYNINSDLVSFQALKIKSAESSDNYAYDDNSELENNELSNAKEVIKKSKPELFIDAAEYRKCTDNDWEGGKGSNIPCLGSKDGAYDPAKVKACGVMPKKYMVETNCNGKLKNLDGRTASAYVIDGMDQSLCKAVDIAIREGYELRFSSAWRDFDTQARGWCRQAAESKGEHSGSRAAPGYSNHGTGQAIDIYLYKDNKSLTLSDFNSQCSIPPDAIEKIAKIFYEADGANFNRLRKEIWHFEYKGLVDAAHGKFIGYPIHCSGKNHS